MGCSVSAGYVASLRKESLDVYNTIGHVGRRHLTWIMNTKLKGVAIPVGKLEVAWVAVYVQAS